MVGEDSVYGKIGTAGNSGGCTDACESCATGDGSACADCGGCAAAGDVFEGECVAAANDSDGRGGGAVALCDVCVASGRGASANVEDASVGSGEPYSVRSKADYAVAGSASEGYARGDVASGVRDEV